MNFIEFKQYAFLPENEIIINKSLYIRDTKALLISITQNKGKNVFWVMLHDPYARSIDEDCSEEYIEREELRTNRDEMIDRIYSNQSLDIFIKELNIQGLKMRFNSSSGNTFYQSNYEEYMKLQHFIEKGIDFSIFNDVDLSSLVLYSYEQEEEGVFPNIDLSKELDISITVDKSYKESLVKMPVTLKVGEYDKNEKYNYLDELTKKEKCFYVDKLSTIDLYQELDDNFNKEETKKRFEELNLSDKEINEMKNSMISGLKNECPEGLDTLALEYESEDNVQLNFYSKEFLDKKPKPKTSSSTSMIFRFEKKTGINGSEIRTCLICPVEKGFNGSIDLELLSCYIEIKEEVIHI